MMEGVIHRMAGGVAFENAPGHMHGAPSPRDANRRTCIAFWNGGEGRAMICSTVLRA
jgi:hypothetical protein